MLKASIVSVIVAYVCLVSVSSATQNDTVIKPSEPPEAGMTKPVAPQPPKPSPQVLQRNDPTKELNKWDGFRGIKWNSELSNLKGFVKDKSSTGKNAVCQRKDEEMKLVGIPLSAVLWMFYENRLLGVNMVSEIGTYSDLVKTMQIRFGNPQPCLTENGLARKKIWDLSKVEEWNGTTSWGAKVSLFVMQRGTAGAVMVEFVYEPLDTKKYEDGKKSQEDTEEKRKEAVHNNANW